MKKVLLILSFILILFISGCTSNSKITPEDAKKMLDEKDNVVLLDVRTSEEYATERIPNALLLPLSIIDTQAKIAIPDKEATYIIYCRSGNRSAQATEILKDMGYKHVYDLGGIIDWPYETISG